MSATPAQFAGQIQGFIDNAVAGLSAPSAVAQQQARKSLIDESENHTGGPATPQYQSLYAADVNKALLQGFKANNNNVHFRINAGVVAAEVAARVLRGDGDVAPLSPIVQALLNDKQSAVVLWGMKAAKYVVADGIQKGANAGVVSKLIVKAMKAHGDVGSIVEEAYNALTFDKLDKVKGNPQFAAWVGPILPDLLDLIAFRAEQYRKLGTPPSPQAERVVSVFLSVTAFPAVNSNPATLNRTLTVMGDLTCSAVGSVAAGNTAQELVDTARDDGRFFDTIGAQMQNQPMQVAGKSIADINANTDPTKMTDRCAGLVAALKGIGVNILPGGGGGAVAAPAQPALAGTPK
jgi:hypothetical protein